MKNQLIFSLFWLFLGTLNAQNPNRLDFPNVLDLKNEIEKPTDVRANIFSDLGAWHGYAFLDEKEAAAGFAGPLVMDLYGRWIAPTAAQMVLKEKDKRLDLNQAKWTHHYYPGFLQQSFEIQDWLVTQTLIFVNERQSMVQTEIKNLSKKKRQLEIYWEAEFYEEGKWGTQQNGLIYWPKDSKSEFRIEFDRPMLILSDGTSYATQFESIQLKSNQQIYFYHTQTWLHPGEKYNGISPSKTTFNQAFQANENRWNNYLNRYFEPTTDMSWAEQKLAVKSMVTLLTNWRSAAGDLKHQGIFPSVSYQGFYGFWSWDSWKQAVAIAYFDPNLAEEVMRSMFDYQDEHGMVADCIYIDHTENNWRDTKPPLAAWAVWEIYQSGGSPEFLSEFYPLLVAYHKWWYENRDHDGNGLCEFGSTDGTRIAAAWESGMDNAVRFDEAEMMQNNPRAWSLNQESIDLNAYLYAEKLYLTQIADELNKEQEAKSWNLEAEQLKIAIQKSFYDDENGYFYDKRLGTAELIKVEGPEAWTALWAGVATDVQAESVKEIMMDSNKFNTLVPLPTFTADHPKFNPMNGYWRGPVWVDQFYFGWQALRKYGFIQEADELQLKFLQNSEGLLEQAPIYENYHPLSGKGLNARNFSWSAAHILMMFRD